MEIKEGITWKYLPQKFDSSSVHRSYSPQPEKPKITRWIIGSNPSSKDLVEALHLSNASMLKGFMGALIVVAVSGLCSAFSPNYVFLLLFRCVLGFGVGGGHVFASWFLEFIPAPNRGAWVFVLTSFWTFGTVLEALLAWIIMPKFGWRWLIALSSLPSFLVLLFSGLTPESPRYLSTKGKFAEAQKILEKVAAMNGAKLPPGILVSDKTIKIDEEHSPLLDTCLLPSDKENKPSSETCLSSLFALLSSKLRSTTLLLWFLYFANTFSYYGIVLMTSELSNRKSKCSSTTNLSRNPEDASLYKDVFITTLAEFPGLLISMVIVDKFGRKLTMGIMCTLSSILLLPLVLHQNEIVTTALLFGGRMFIMSTFNTIVTYSREVYPTSLRATGVGLATSIGRIGGMICPLVAVGLVRDCHQTAAIILFEAVIVLIGFGILFLPLETSGKGLSDTIPLSDEE